MTALIVERKWKIAIEIAGIDRLPTGTPSYATSSIHPGILAGHSDTFQQSLAPSMRI